MEKNTALNYWKQLQQSESQPYEIPEPPKSYVEQREQLKKDREDWDKEKEYNKRYSVLKRNIETCVEARPQSDLKTKDLQAIQYFTQIKGDVEKKLQQSKLNFETLIAQEKQRMETLQQKLSFVETRLQTAVERSKMTVKRSKEEIRCRKELEQLIETVKKELPKVNLETVFPGYKALLEIQGVPPHPPPPIPSKMALEDTGNQSLGDQKTVKEEPVKSEKEFSTEKVEMPTPDGKPAVFTYGKRVPKNMSLEEAIARQNNPQLSFEPVETQPEQKVVPKIIRITKKKPAEEPK